MGLIVVFCILFVFILVLYCFCVVTEFSVNKDLYIKGARRTLYICIFIRINCSFKNKKLKKTKEKDAHNVSKSITCKMPTNYAQRKRKVTLCRQQPISCVNV